MSDRRKRGADDVIDLTRDFDGSRAKKSRDLPAKSPSGIGDITFSTASVGEGSSLSCSQVSNPSQIGARDGEAWDSTQEDDDRVRELYGSFGTWVISRF